MRAVMREVNVDGGLVLPDGRSIPKGTLVGTLVSGIHNDENFYTNPSQFDPFRFMPAKDSSEKIGKTPEIQKEHDLPTISESYLAWGYGHQSW